MHIDLDLDASGRCIRTVRLMSLCVGLLCHSQLGIVIVYIIWHLNSFEERYLVRMMTFLKRESLGNEKRVRSLSHSTAKIMAN